MPHTQRALRTSLGLTLIIALSLLATPGLAQPPAWDDPLLEAAKEYATDNHVDVAEATRRLHLQLEAGYLNETLVNTAPDTFAGLQIEHQPQFRLKVLFAAGTYTLLQPYLSPALFGPFLAVELAPVSMTQLEADQREAIKTLSQLPVSFDCGINGFKHQVEVYVLDAAAYQALLTTQNITLPPTVKIIQVPGLAQPNLGP